MPFDEVTHVDVKSLDTTNEHNPVVNCECCNLEKAHKKAVEQARDDEERWPSEKSGCSPEDCIARFGRGCNCIENDVQRPNDEVSDASQGGCLASEVVARNPCRYGGLVVLSGSLLGPETKRDYTGSIDGTPVFLGCSTEDPYVPADRIHESAHVFEQLDAGVTSRLYDGLGHAINDDEIQKIKNEGCRHQFGIRDCAE